MKPEPFRLDGHRGAPLRFSFNDRQLLGRVGDTLAAALLANGIHWVGRSFKYHRPRGIVAAGVEEPNAFVAVGRGPRVEPSIQATAVQLFEGLEAHSLNAWPSLRWDARAVFGWFGRFLPAGFYYKTFMRPGWRFFEGAVRKAAGIGVAPAGADPDRYEARHRHCELLIVGGGPAGLAAALAAARAGVEVVLAEQDFLLGGSCLWREQRLVGEPAGAWVSQTAAELASLPNVTLLTRTAVTSYLDHNCLLAVESVRDGAIAQRLWRLRADHVILATGAIERPLVFPDNDRPGIMLGSAVQQYAVRHRVAVGRRIVVVTNNTESYRLAATLHAAGIAVAAIVDTRADGPASIPDVPIYRGAGIVGTDGSGRVSQVTVQELQGARRWRIDCDAVAMSGGWSPVIQLFAQSGGKLGYDSVCGAFLPAQAMQKTRVVGAAAGQWSLSQCLQGGFDAASAITRVLGREPADSPDWKADHDPPFEVTPFWQISTQLAGSRKQWIDFQNDVTASDVALAARENFRSVEHLKRYTTLGMALDQGKTSNMNGLAILGQCTGRAPNEVGTTTFRPPFTPIRFGALVGRERGALYHPSRRLPTHNVQHLIGAQMHEYGAWLRPACYPRAGEALEITIEREVRAVRTAVGILDYSPLGKIEVLGPDALRFLNRMVATNLETLKCGRARYSLTLTDGGAITDDGVVSRWGDDHFLMGTTSGAVARIYSFLEEWRQREWSDLDVDLVNVTSHWAVLMLSGPSARALLRRTDIDIDVSPTAFPHMAVREGRLGGVPVRVSRVSFTGEVSYEVALPARHAASLWSRFFALGEDLGLSPVGIEALDVLRLEKGFIHVGTDTDGTTIPHDVGYEAMVHNKRTDFLGRRSLDLPEMRRQGRPQLVGLEPLDSDRPLAVGAQLASRRDVKGGSGLGHVTSSAWSPTLARPLALALLAGGRERLGDRLFAWANGTFRPVEVCEPQRYDSRGVVLNG